MASGGTLTQSSLEKSLPAKMNSLKVRGTAISPRPGTPTTDELVPHGACKEVTLTSHPSSAASTSEDDDLKSLTSGEAYNVLQSVVTVNQTLENQISALRMRLDVEAKQHRADKEKLAIQKDKMINEQEVELCDLRGSLLNREERISVLVQASQQKDTLIQEKMSEIEELRKVVAKTEGYAKELNKQITKLKVEKKHLESDALYKEQNEEIGRLKKEVRVLKEKLDAMDIELKRARNIIEQQNVRIGELDSDKVNMHARFKEELDKASRAMRQEVERMREVMKQNYEEIRNLREQNHEMHDDVREIKDMLLKGKTPRVDGLGPKTATTDINMSSFVTGIQPKPPPRVQSPTKNVHASRRSLEQLSVNLHKTPRVSRSPSGSRVNLTKSPKAAPRLSGPRSTISQNSAAAGLPPIAYVKENTSRWIPAGRNSNHSAASRRSGPKK